MTYEVHPACAAWPPMNEADFTELVASIRERGLVNPIVIYEGKILDGKERQRACDLASAIPHYMPYLGDDPVGHSLALNKNRRHLSKSQLAMIAEELATLKRGGNNPAGSNQYQVVKAFAKASTTEEETMVEIGEKLGVSRSSIQAARTLKKNAESPVHMEEHGNRNRHRRVYGAHDLLVRGQKWLSG